MEKCNNCFADVLSIKDICECVNCTENFYLHDFVPVIKSIWFDDLASEDYQTGYNLARVLLNNAANTVYADITRAIPQSVNINNSIWSHCNDCTFTEIYQQRGGITITNNIASSITKMSLGVVQIKTNYTGTTDILVIDKNTSDILHTVPITLTAGAITQINLSNLELNTNAVTLRLSNGSIGVSTLLCKQSGGCGSCGKKSNKPAWVNYLGELNGVASSTQYGFIPCVTVVCNQEDLVCAVVKNRKSIVARAMAYQVGIELFSLLLMNNNNRGEALNVNKEVAESNINTLMGKYEELIFGSKASNGHNGTNGLVQLLEMQKMLLGREDNCVICVGNRFVANGIN